MNPYRFVLFLHIASAMLLVGGSLAGLLVRSAARRSSTLGAMSAVLALGRPLEVLNPLSAFALLGTGIYLASVGRWWTFPWVLVPAALWIVNMILAKAVVGRVVDGLVALAPSGVEGPLTPEVHRLRDSAAWTLGGNALVALDMAAVLLMTLRPALVPSLAVVAAAVAAVLTLTALGRLRQASSAGRVVRVES